MSQEGKTILFRAGWNHALSLGTIIKETDSSFLVDVDGKTFVAGKVQVHFLEDVEFCSSYDLSQNKWVAIGKARNGKVVCRGIKRETIQESDEDAEKASRGEIVLS